MTQTTLDTRVPAGGLPPGTRQHLLSPVTQAALRIQNSITAATRPKSANTAFSFSRFTGSAPRKSGIAARTGSPGPCK